MAATQCHILSMEETPELRWLLGELLVEQQLVVAARNAGLFAVVDAAEARAADITRRINVLYGH
jgi:hypothetical protein